MFQDYGCFKSFFVSVFIRSENILIRKVSRHDVGNNMVDFLLAAASSWTGTVILSSLVPVLNHGSRC